ncbi:GNAT family protein [Bacillus sp. 165]|uniref:GNAT family N-acetyltransferase n=1 Tax=Bacillus sp. 165 TaxID=1529117 RepID=UPI001ADC0834|nr:GNAT family protein [Bacillus sp. 165]MBO9129275.1 GNAT family N-acetyltransferase [Bacillus sp. 165]
MHHKYFENIETNRLQLRQFHIEDIHSFFAYRSNPEVAKYQSWENYRYEQAVSFVEDMSKSSPNISGSWFQIAVALKESNVLIGDCAIHTLHSEPRIVEIGYTFATEYQGKGYAFEAVNEILYYIFSILNKHKVMAYTDVRNISSINLLEKLGMRREGHLLQNFMSKGKWVDEYQYALLKSEWDTRK